ncbi:hypothetical protein TELCIR_06013 [Teladorsagia circumcincta]|uniref:Uncharacterized protein n=1 Tax=Teladorsagia circumcincta TaxID=45464 RepID=A0A2G9UP48_TELCI|nr:hypothetical protein TELCIR_06013 [Teladorsagia circumcincta]
MIPSVDDTASEIGQESKKQSTLPNEDDYICDTCSTPRNMSTFSRSAMSVEGVLLKVLTEVAQLLRKIKIVRSPRREQTRQKLSACRQRTTVIWTDPNP